MKQKRWGLKIENEIGRGWEGRVREGGGRWRGAGGGGGEGAVEERGGEESLLEMQEFELHSTFCHLVFVSRWNIKYKKSYLLK